MCDFCVVWVRAGVTRWLGTTAPGPWDTGDAMTKQPARHRTRRARLTTGALTLGLVVALAAPATARPVLSEHNHDSWTGYGVCDANISDDATIDETFSVITHQDGTVGYTQDNFRLSEVFTNLDTGRTFRVDSTGAFKDLRITDNGDGTYTFLSQQAGTSVAWDDSGAVVSRDSGLIRVQGSYDTQGTPLPFDDVLVTDYGVVSTAGPHVSLTHDFCTDLLHYTA